MPIREEDLKRIVGKRMLSSRKAAGLRNEDVMRAMGHKGKTQLSLFENGQRLPPLHLAVMYCNHVGISLDYMTGRIDDPLADFTEINRGVILQAVRTNIGSSLSRLSDAITRQVVLSTHEREQDRAELTELVRQVRELQESMNKFIEKTPEFEDMPAGSAVKYRMERMAAMANKTAARHEAENADRERAMAMMDVECAMSAGERGQGALWGAR